MSDGSGRKTSLGFQFQSYHLDEFRAEVSKRIRPCRFRTRGVRYEASLQHHRAGNIGFSVVSVNPGLDVAVDPVEDSHLFQIALSGKFRARCHGEEHTYDRGDVHVVNPDAPLRIAITPGAQLLVVRIAKTTLEEHARILGDTSDDGPLLLPEMLPGDHTATASLRRYLEFLHAESRSPGSPVHSGCASRSAEQMLTSLMIALKGRDAAPASSTRPKELAVVDHVRRAEDFMDAHADDDIGLVDIVATSGVDARTLESGFRRRRDATPLAFLEARRAERTARELDGDTSADEERPSLTARELEIARLVAGGFNNLEIANLLEISRNTIKEALKRVFRKVGVDSRAELVMRLSEARLL